MNYNHGVGSELIKQNTVKLLAELSDGVEVVAAAKTRTLEEVLEAVRARIKISGENYVNEVAQAPTLGLVFPYIRDSSVASLWIP